MFCRWIPRLVACFCASFASANEPLTFEKDIRPIFRAHCFDCHGAEEKLKGGLDLRLVRFMQKGGDSGPAISLDAPAESLLLQRVRDGEMPPGNGHVADEEIAILEEWIAQGAKTVRSEPETIGPGLGVTPEERSFWSFQPVQRPQVPELSSFAPEARVRSAIDALVLKSMPAGVAFAADADRPTLIKRAYFDLIGLPPSPEEMQTWLSDSTSDWYDRMLTELLSSPHYGERWGRHWLDVAGYADSEGYTNNDSERPWAWQYRDWVIKALNEDKPFDQFLTEQIAGDELAGPQNGDLTPKQIDLLAATGYLRMAADGTGSGANNAEARNQVMTDTLKIVGTSLLGLSVQCAQCHDHRYDPIPQTDYYALRAIFEPALDWQAWKVPNARRVSLYTQADRDKSAELEKRTAPIAAEKAKLLAEYMQTALDTELAKYPEPLREQLRTAYKTMAAERTDEQKKLLSQHPSVNISRGNLYQYIAESKPKLAEFDKKIAEIRAKKPVEQFLRALVEPANHVPETKLFHRGDHQQPKQKVMPASLTVAAAEDARPEFPANNDALPSTGRRLAFARWLTNGQHPLVARVIVNRLWLHHFGKGLVATPSDFGKLGVAPSNPQLLDWLAAEFVNQGWSIKQFHRLVMKSTTWRQSSVAQSPADRSVPHARRRLTRLTAETIRDRMLAASGQLDRTLFGPAIAIKEDDTGQIVVEGLQKRRSLYIKARRSQPVAMLQAFDAPVMQTNCEVRPSSTVATQSLMLMNGEFILAQATHLANRAAEEAPDVDVTVIKHLSALPRVFKPTWSFGFGSFDEATNRTDSFTPFSHFVASRWQAGPTLPDPQLGYVSLTLAGGHPDTPARAAVRRWTAPESGVVSVTGELSHGSANGDGVRGRIVSNRSGKHGEWTASNGTSNTEVVGLTVEAGDSIDFITDCRASITSDSFNWPVTIGLKNGNGDERKFVSAEEFAGPHETPEQIVGQIMRIFELALCRQPSQAELETTISFVSEQIRLHSMQQSSLPQGVTAERQAVTDVCHALFASNEFLYIE